MNFTSTSPIQGLWTGACTGGIPGNDLDIENTYQGLVTIFSRLLYVRLIFVTGINLYGVAFDDALSWKEKGMKVNIETLILFGTEDFFLSVDIPKYHGKYFNNLKIRYMDGATHWAPMTSLPFSYMHEADLFYRLLHI